MLSNKLISSKSENTQRLNKNQRCERILSVSKKILLNKGYPNVNIDEIISIAGGSKGSIYECFGDKDSLIIAIFEELSALFCKRIQECNKGYLKGKKPDIQKLKKELSNYTKDILTEDTESFLRNLLISSVESACFNKANQKIYQDIINSLAPIFSESIEQGKERAALYLEVLCTSVFLNQFFYQSEKQYSKSTDAEISNSKFLIDYISDYIFSELNS